MRKMIKTFDLDKYPIRIEKKGMEKIFVDVKWLGDFLKKEGADAYNSLLLSNKVISNGFITYITIKLPFSKKQLEKRRTF